MEEFMIKRLIKTKSKQTYKGKDGKEHNYYNYWLEFENGKRIQIKAVFTQDNSRLDMVADYLG